MTCEMNDIRRAANRLALTILSAMALLASGCSEVEGPLPLRNENVGRIDPSAVNNIGEIRAPKGTSTASIIATCVSGNPDSRAVILPDDDGAAVLWEEGDSIMVQFLRDGQFYYSVMRTKLGGSSTAVFTTEDDIFGGSAYIFFSPSYLRKTESSNLSGERIFGLEIRQYQTAVAGGVMADSNLAFARSDSFEDGMSLNFTNLPAMLRFRLSGGLAGSVKSVTLRSAIPISGLHMIYDKAGSPAYYPDRYAVNPYPSVTLSGDFEADKEYNIVLWPKELLGFEMEFSDGEGNYSILRTTDKLTFHQSEVIDIGTINLGDVWCLLGSVSMDPVKYLSATEGTKPVTIAVIPDGFTEAELPLFESLAKMALDKLFDTEPYKTYKNRFNAWILKVASNQSGAGVTDGNGNVITPVDNYFGTKWAANTNSEDMRAADDNKVFNFVIDHCPDIQSGINTINEVPVIIIVNDPRWGGRSWVYNDGRAYCIDPWALSGNFLTWSYPYIVPKSESNPQGGYRRLTADELASVKKNYGDWRNTLVHEFGHVFGRLADEYWNTSQATTASAATINNCHSWPIPYGLNISSSYSTTPWDELKNKRPQLMEIDSRYSRIGVYQGGWNHIYGAWRSEMVSGMIDNRFYYSAWCRYLIAKRIMTLSGDLTSFNYEYWLERDVTFDPIRDEPATRSDLDRSGRYYYIFPHESEDYFPPDAPVGFVEDEYSYVRTD